MDPESCCANCMICAILPGSDSSQTTQLLYALRPFLKDGKQNKVERAARLARLITIGKRFLSEGGGFPV